MISNLRSRPCTTHSAPRQACEPHRLVNQPRGGVLPSSQRLRVGPVCRTGSNSSTTNAVTSEPATVVSSASAAGVADTIAPAHPAPVPSPAAAAEEARQLVDQVLEAIKGTDSGLAISPEDRRRVDDMLDRLEQLGAAQQPRPLENPLLWGNYNVAYTSVGRSRERGEPAGGRFRGRIGRALFRTAGLFQSVLEPDIATNKVEFKLFGMLPGFVGLRGRVVPSGDNGDTVKVLFEPPVLSIADKVHLRIGRPSSVELTTTYLDERVRLGKGSRGSLFVFTRGGAADQAGMDLVGRQRTSITAAAIFSAFFVSLFLGGAALWVSGMAALKAAALAMWLLGAAVGGVVRQGGLVMDKEDERMAEAVKAEMERKAKAGVPEAQAGTPEGGAGAGTGAGSAAPAAA